MKTLKDELSAAHIHAKKAYVSRILDTVAAYQARRAQRIFSASAAAAALAGVGAFAAGRELASELSASGFFVFARIPFSDASLIATDGKSIAFSLLDSLPVEAAGLFFAMLLCAGLLLRLGARSVREARMKGAYA